MNALRRLLVGLMVALLAAPGALATKDAETWRLLVRKGGESFRAKDFMQAARLWHRATKLRPSAELWYRVGIALYKADEKTKATNALKKALALDPDHAKATRALKRLDPSETDPPDPGQGPDDPGDDPGDGGEATPPSLDRLEGVTIDVDEGRAEQAWTDAHRYRKLGEYQKAVGRFVEAYRFGYAQPEVDFYLGQALLEDEVLDGALVHLRRARQAVPQDQGVCLLLGKTYALQGDSSEQIEVLETAVRLDPGYAEAHFQLALAMDMVGDSGGVLEHSQKAIRIDPAYRDKLEDALRDGAVVGKLRDLLKSTLAANPDAPPPNEEELDGYATRLAKLLYPAALPELRGQKAGKKQAAESSFAPEPARSSSPAPAKNALRLRDKTESLADKLRQSSAKAQDAGGAPPSAPSEDLADDAFGGGVEDLGGAAPGADEDVLGDTEELDEELGTAEGGTRPASPAPTLAGIQFRLVRQILQDLHEGKGRRAFERVPHADRARFKQDFLAAIRSRPGLADLRRRVEAALRES
jgi:tetratricopeptide (TPR) repeat protein